MLEIAGVILELCREPKMFEEILQGVFARYQLTMDFNQYVLVGSTVRSYRPTCWTGAPQRRNSTTTAFCGGRCEAGASFVKGEKPQNGGFRGASVLRFLFFTARNSNKSLCVFKDFPYFL